MGVYSRLHDFLAPLLQYSQRACLVSLHQPRITGYVCDGDSGQAALGSFFSHLERLMSANAGIVLEP